MQDLCPWQLELHLCVQFRIDFPDSQMQCKASNYKKRAQQGGKCDEKVTQL